MVSAKQQCSVRKCDQLADFARLINFNIIIINWFYKP